MQKILHHAWIVAIALMLCVPAGCGFWDDDHQTELAKDESIYETGNGVPAVKYADAQTIQLFIWDEKDGQGKFEPVANGAYVTPAKHRLGVTVTPRKVDGAVIDQRVFFGNGGWDYQVEALYDKDLQMYTAEFAFLAADQFLTHPVLIQVIGADGLASKEKYVLHTRFDLGAKPDELVRQGLGVTMSSGGVNTLLPALLQVIPGAGGFTLPDTWHFSPADGTGEGILTAHLGFAQADIILADTDTNGNRGLYLGVENLKGDTPANILDAIGSAFTNLLFQDLFQNLVRVPRIKVWNGGLDLASLLASPEDTTGSASTSPQVELPAPLFLDLYGMPQATTKDFAALGGAIYVGNPATVKKDADGNLIWPELALNATTCGIDMDRIKVSHDKVVTDLGVALSQYNLNQALPALLQGLKITIPQMDVFMQGFVSPEVKGNHLDGVITINPGGFALDLVDYRNLNPAYNLKRRITANDVRLTFIEKASPADTGTPKLEMSVDVTMYLDDVSISIGKDAKSNTDKGTLNLSITPDYHHCFIHIMRDNLGMTMFDHGKLFAMIIQGFTGGKDTIALQIPISDIVGLPEALMENGQIVTDTAGNVVYKNDQGYVQFDEKGNCFVGLAVKQLDLKNFDFNTIMGGCFIATAGY